ncbi:MAG: hypothetical protein ACK4GO_17205 [Gemmobacter sp.]
MNDENDLAQTALQTFAGMSVDLCISKSKEQGSDPIEALDGLILFSELAAQLAKEAKARIARGRGTIQ